jgi:small subunit ribosomal protein S6
MRQYETGFLLSPSLSEEETEKIILQMADIVSQKNGRMMKLDKWGKRRLAYPIKRFGEAFYVFFHYEGGADIPLELGRKFKQMDTVLRYLTLKKDTRDNVRKKKRAAEEAKKREGALEEGLEVESELEHTELSSREMKEEER